MDNSTEGVTLYAGFLTDLLCNYRGREKTIAAELFAMVEGLDLSNPTAQVPIQRYNEMCDWIEDNLGPANLRKAGEAIGDRVYGHLEASGMIDAESTPIEILEGLKKAADHMVQDPRGRGWTILDKASDRVVMRRTQTFHPVLQEGLLRSLVEHAQGVRYVSVDYLASVARGDDYDDFEVRWF